MGRLLMIQLPTWPGPRALVTLLRRLTDLEITRLMWTHFHAVEESGLERTAADKYLAKVLCLDLRCRGLYLVPTYSSIASNATVGVAIQ